MAVYDKDNNIVEAKNDVWAKIKHHFRSLLILALAGSTVFFALKWQISKYEVEKNNEIFEVKLEQSQKLTQ